jgi:hypothetical protein
VKPTVAIKPGRAARKERRTRKPAPAAPQPPAQHQPQPVAKPRELWTVRSRRNLGRAIWAANDPVEVATRLLKGEGDATVAKSYFQVADWIYGRPAQQSGTSGPEGERAFRFVTYVPRPQYAVDPNSEDQRNKEACRQSLAGAPGAAGTNFEEVTQEDENDQHE